MANATHRDADMGNQLMTRLDSENGTTLIETMIAVGMLLVVMGGLMSMVTVATTITENQGHLGARTTEYAQDKMEQLLAIAYGDEQTDTVAGAPTGGTGLKVGGGTDPANPVNQYVDWLDKDGTLLGGGQAQPANWYYERVWQVSCLSVSCTDNPPAGLKQVTVTARVRTAFGGALIPQSSVSTMKTWQF